MSDLYAYNWFRSPRAFCFYLLLAGKNQVARTCISFSAFWYKVEKRVWKDLEVTPTYSDWPLLDVVDCIIAFTCQTMHLAGFTWTI